MALSKEQSLARNAQYYRHQLCYNKIAFAILFMAKLRVSP